MKNLNNQSTFDFEYWRKLAEENPALFEKKRREEIDKMICGAPAGEMQERLQRLQWRVDMERRRCKTATQSCIRIYGMMWKRVYGESGLLESLNQLIDYNKNGQPEVLEDKNKADVLRFQASNT
jgi:hypothetical protein